MKLFHLADLHIGKRVNEFSMLEDQRYILDQVLGYADSLHPDGILIAGDVYDKTLPPAEAVELFDRFLTGVADRGISCFVTGGNHDSAERIAFGAGIMNARAVYLSRVFRGGLEPVTMGDEFGEVDVYMLPFIKPVHVRGFYPDAVIENCGDAVKAVLSGISADYTRRRVLLAHQFVTHNGAEPARCESESSSLGGLDGIDAAVFDAFDYVALGHIHGPQHVGRETVRYAGSPLKYSFSEAGHRKSLSVVTLERMGEIRIETVPLEPLRDLREIRGPLERLLSQEIRAEVGTENYLHVTLTDEEEILDALEKVRYVYPNVMRLDYDNRRTRASGATAAVENITLKTPLQLFSEFYQLQNNREMDRETTETVREMLHEEAGA